MTNTTPLNFVHKVGKFGDNDKKNQNNILKVSEINELLIFQIVQYNKSSFDVSKIRLDSLSFPSSLKSTSNSNTRILWIGPNNWLVFSSVLDLFKKEKNQFNEAEFAITDVSHSRIIIELEGNLVNEVLKKGCPLDINSLKDGDCANSVYNGINITIDFISESPKKVRILGLRSYGESLHHSVTDACLEFGYDAI